MSRRAVEGNQVLKMRRLDNHCADVPSARESNLLFHGIDLSNRNRCASRRSQRMVNIFE